MDKMTNPIIDVEDEIDIDESVSIESTEPLVGIVANCKRLNIRKEPDVKAERISVVDVDSVLMIEPDESTADWYRVYTEAGVEGFCMKKFVKLSE